MLVLVSNSNNIADFYRKILSDFHITDDLSKNLLMAVSSFIAQSPINNSKGTDHGSEDINMTKDFPYYKEVYWARKS